MESAFILSVWVVSSEIICSVIWGPWGLLRPGPGGLRGFVGLGGLGGLSGRAVIVQAIGRSVTNWLFTRLYLKDPTDNKIKD